MQIQRMTIKLADNTKVILIFERCDNEIDILYAKSPGAEKDVRRWIENGLMRFPQRDKNAKMIDHEFRYLEPGDPELWNEIIRRCKGYNFLVQLSNVDMENNDN